MTRDRKHSDHKRHKERSCSLDPLKCKVKEHPELLDYNVDEKCCKSRRRRRDCSYSIEYPTCAPRGNDYRCVSSCSSSSDSCSSSSSDSCYSSSSSSCSSSSSSCSSSSSSCSSRRECRDCRPPCIQKITYKTNCCPPPCAPRCAPARCCRGAQGCRGMTLQSGYLPGLGWNYYANVGWAGAGCCRTPVFTGMWY